MGPGGERRCRGRVCRGPPVCLAIVNLTEAVAHLEGCGIEVQRFRPVAGAGDQAFVRDPWGNPIELNEQ